MRYLNQKAVKERIKASGRRCGKDFLSLLDAFVEEKIGAACRVHDGGKKTLSASVGLYSGIKLKGRD